MRVTEKACISLFSCNVASVHFSHQSRVVGTVAHRTELLFAESTFPASDLEACDDSVADLELLDSRSDLLDDSGELMSEQVSLLQAQDLAVVQVQVGTADGGSGHFENDVGVLSDIGNVGVDDLDAVGSLPSQGLHTLFSALADLVRVLGDHARSGAGVGLESVGDGLHCRYLFCGSFIVDKFVRKLRVECRIDVDLIGKKQVPLWSRSIRVADADAYVLACLHFSWTFLTSAVADATT
jgi:hypothetical protein